MGQVGVNKIELIVKILDVYIIHIRLISIAAQGRGLCAVKAVTQYGNSFFSKDLIVFIRKTCLGGSGCVLGDILLYAGNIKNGNSVVGVYVGNCSVEAFNACGKLNAEPLNRGCVGNSDKSVRINITPKQWSGFLFTGSK